MTFTSDHGMVERAEPRLEAAIGVWKRGDREAEFRFMFYRFLESLTVTEPEEQEGVAVSFRHHPKSSLHQPLDERRCLRGNWDS
jgi:hypothetical protein